MSSRFVILLTTLIITAACASDSRSTNAGKLVVLNSVIFEDGDVLSNVQPSTQRPGTWTDKDGSKFCDGFLTRNEGVDFCSSTAPKDWRSFTYGGVEYYYQPLGGT